MFKLISEISDQILMMGSEMDSEASAIFNQLTRLIAREDYIIQ
jgi:hypothetical protein